MRLYSFKKSKITQGLWRHDLSFMKLRFAALAVTVSCVVYLSPAAYAEDQSVRTPASNTFWAYLEEFLQPKAQVKMVNRPQIAGLWGTIIRPKRCIEYYNFKENGQVVVKNAGEWSLGKYMYQLPDMDEMSVTLPQLAMVILYDSNVMDCSGSNINQRGDVQQQFVKWINPSHIQFCATGDGKQCPLDLYRVLR